MLQTTHDYYQPTFLQFNQGWAINSGGSRELVAPGGQIDVGDINIAYDQDGLIYT